MSTITAYRKVGELFERCAFGTDHPVSYYEVKRLTDTGETREYDNGYTIDQTGLFRDTQGRIYHNWPPIDYSGGSRFVREDRASFSLSAASRQLSRDLLGQSLNEQTPAGPAWEDLVDEKPAAPFKPTTRKRPEQTKRNQETHD